MLSPVRICSVSLPSCQFELGHTLAVASPSYPVAPPSYPAVAIPSYPAATSHPVVASQSHLPVASPSLPAIATTSHPAAAATPSYPGAAPPFSPPSPLLPSPPSPLLPSPPPPPYPPLSLPPHPPSTLPYSPSPLPTHNHFALSTYYRSGPAPSDVSQVDPLPLAEPFEVTVDSGTARGGAARGVASGGAEPVGAEPGGAEIESAEPGGAEPEGAESGGAETEGAEPWGAESEGAESWGAELRGTASAGGPAGASPRQSHQREPLSPRQLREWFARRTRLRSGTTGARGPAAGGTAAGGAGATSPGVTTGAGGTGGAGTAGCGGARTRGTGAAGAGGVGGAGAGDPGAGGAGAGGARAGGAGAGDPGAGGAGAGGARVGDPGAGGAGAGGAGAGGIGAGGLGADPGAGRAGGGDPRAGGAGAGGTGAGGTMERRPFFVPPPPSSLPPPGSVLRHVLSLPSSTDLTPSLLCLPPHQSQPQLQPDSSLPPPSPYAEQTDSLTEHREPESRPASPVRAVRTGRRVPRPRPSPIRGTHIMAIRPSSVPLRVPVPSPPASSLADATVVTDPSFESAVASALVAELVDFAAACRLDYAASLVAESESHCPSSIRGECALGTDVLEDSQEDFEWLASAVPHLVAMLLAHEGDPDAPDIPTPRSYAEAITGPYSSQWQTAMDAEMPSWKSIGTYVDAVPPPGANIVDGMWIFRVKWQICSSPHVFKACYVARGFDKSLPPIYILVYVDNLVFATADTEALALVKSELQKRHTYTGLGPSALRLPVLLATVHSSTYRSLALSSTFERVRRAKWPELRWLTYQLTDLGEWPRSPPVLLLPTNQGPEKRPSSQSRLPPVPLLDHNPPCLFPPFLFLLHPTHIHLHALRSHELPCSPRLALDVVAMAAVANSARRVLTAAASEANVAVRRFHAAPTRSAAAGSGNEPAYLHAHHMYDIASIKNRKLKFGVAVFGSVAFGIAVPLIAVWHQQIKARG
ncbi:unnamed protein product [Closterium sp. NIES-54]